MDDDRLNDWRPLFERALAAKGQLAISAISLWEAHMLNARGRIELPAAFHGDPADRIIVATAQCRGMSLATWDKALRRLRSIEIWRA